MVVLGGEFDDLLGGEGGGGEEGGREEEGGEEVADGGGRHVEVASAHRGGRVCPRRAGIDRRTIAIHGHFVFPPPGAGDVVGRLHAHEGLHLHAERLLDA